MAFTDSRPLPTPPSNHLLVKVHASAIQPSDGFNAVGGFPTTTFPRIPGRDFSGVVVASGNPTSTAIGSSVFGTSGCTHGFTEDGAHAEYIVVPQDGVAAKPASLTHVQAATVGVPFTTAAMTVEKSGAKSGDTVLVLGANGAVGGAVCLLLKSRGCRILRAVRGPGGDVDTSADPELKSVRSQHIEKGVDVIIDAVGLPSLTKAGLEEALGHNGRLVFIAAPKPPTSTELSFDMRSFYRAEKQIIGVNSVDHPIQEVAASLASLSQVFEMEETKNMLNDSKWEQVSLKDGVQGYLSLHKNKKCVLVMDSE